MGCVGLKTKLNLLVRNTLMEKGTALPNVGQSPKSPKHEALRQLSLKTLSHSLAFFLLVVLNIQYSCVLWLS